MVCCNRMVQLANRPHWLVERHDSWSSNKVSQSCERHFTILGNISSLSARQVIHGFKGTINFLLKVTSWKLLQLEGVKRFRTWVPPNFYSRVPVDLWVSQRSPFNGVKIMTCHITVRLFPAYKLKYQGQPKVILLLDIAYLYRYFKGNCIT